MIRNWDPHKACLIVTLACLSLSACSGKKTLTEQDVRAFYANLESALNAQDADDVLAQLSEDAKLSMQAPTLDGEQAIRMTKNDYAANLRQSFETLQDYIYHIDSLDIQIAADATSADVHTAITETMKIDGQGMQAGTKEHTRLELRAGKIQAVAVDAIVTLQ